MFYDDWNLIAEAHSATGGFLDGSYIEKYPRESDDKLTERRKIAYYPNLVAPKINRYNGYLFKKDALRKTNNQMLQAILQDVDNKGNSINVFMQNFSLETKLRGCNLLLVDNVASISSNNLADQIGNRELPYFISIAPERVTKFKMNKYGSFDFVAYTDTIDNSTFSKEDIKKVTRYYDANSWAVLDGDEIIESGDHNLGVCPVLYIAEKDLFPCKGEFTQLGSLMKRYYNLLSEEDELLRGQTFSILAIQAKERTPNVSLGTDNALVYDGDKEPTFLTPTSIPTSAYEAKISKIEETIDRVTYDVTTTSSNESGVALEIKFDGLNSSLSAFATKLEDLEIRAFDVVCRYLGINNDIEIKYPSEFNVVDMSTEIEKLILMDSVADLPIYKQKKLEEIVKNDLSNISEQDLLEIFANYSDEKKDVGEF